MDANTKETKPAVITDTWARKIEEKREKYLSEVTTRGDAVERQIGSAATEIHLAHMEQLKELYLPLEPKEVNDKNTIRYFDITKWVVDPREKNLDKLVTVYRVLGEEKCNIALIYRREPNRCRVMLAVVNTDKDRSQPEIAMMYRNRLVEAIRGNFPGVELREIGDKEGVGVPDFLKPLLAAAEETTGDSATVTARESPVKSVNSVAIVSNMVSERSEDFLSQTMEKLLDGAVPKEEKDSYTLVLLASPVKDVLGMKNRLFELYSQLAPYASWQSSHTTSDSRSEGTANTVHGGVSIRNFGLGFARSSTTTVQTGTSDGITRTYTNYGIQYTLDVIKDRLKKLDESAALCMWDFAAYAVSRNPVMANNVAHMYLALTQGEKSYMTASAVSLWSGKQEKEKDKAEAILRWIGQMKHPEFALNEELVDAENGRDWLMYPARTTPAVKLSGKELARALNFPSRSVSGLPVLESTPFGREVVTFRAGDDAGDGMEVGKIYHMRREEPTPVRLDVNSLTAHTFITGSTGTGKSNTVYQLLTKLREKLAEDFHTLVVEPAKGEYKDVFGEKYKVYGTNPLKTELLRINPFSFPEDILVLEHIDRLIEVLNACWPMYAAMPAVLKDAVEKSYERVGWNLRRSQCVRPKRFPTFEDLLETLPEVMRSSLYSEDTRSDYAGALVTRVRSLTNGINGQIFCGEKELTDDDLFENDVIVDLSRVGSGETKAMLMGILVMKLQEHRMLAPGMEQNAKLKHVTVLEEAHNLLRRTSFDQFQEGANLQGKAVEMITNSIAEMRTYGEGFIIADQAPGLLDEAVIRNTNTKIVLRLPDREDRKLVGDSMALTEEQIAELAKLPTGVAAVYQNDWAEAVLCKFEKFEDAGKHKWTYTPPAEDGPVLERYFLRLFGVRDDRELTPEEVETVREWLRGLRTTKATAKALSDCLEGRTLEAEERETVAYNVFAGKSVAELLESAEDNRKGIELADRRIMSLLGFEDSALAETVRMCILGSILRMNAQSELVSRYRGPEPSGGRVL